MHKNENARRALPLSRAAGGKPDEGGGNPSREAPKGLRHSRRGRGLRAQHRPKAARARSPTGRESDRLRGWLANARAAPEGRTLNPEGFRSRGRECALLQRKTLGWPGPQRPRAETRNKTNFFTTSPGTAKLMQETKLISRALPEGQTNTLQQVIIGAGVWGRLEPPRGFARARDPGRARKPLFLHATP